MPWGIAAAAVVGGIASAVSSSNAADAQVQAAQTASDAQLKMYGQTRKDLLPYNQGGQKDFRELNRLINSPAYINGPQLTESALRNSPGYQFNLNQGLKATQNAAAARGLGVSGAALKGASAYATGLADSTYQNQFNDAVTNQTNAYNRLMGGAQIGENAAAQTGAYGTQTATNVGNNIIGAGNAQAAGIIGTGNAFSGAANSLGNAYVTNQLLGSSGLYGGSGGFSMGTNSANTPA
jgi:hypothetical protein